MFATITVIEEAAKRNANFIIAHEPTFYNHRDDMSWVKDSVVIMRKKELIEKHGLAIWRFHDYCHSCSNPTALHTVSAKGRLAAVFQDGREGSHHPHFHCSNWCNISSPRWTLPTSRSWAAWNNCVSRVTLLPGAWGVNCRCQQWRQEHPDVLIVGEVSEWETGIHRGREIARQTDRPHHPWPCDE